MEKTGKMVTSCCSHVVGRTTIPKFLTGVIRQKLTICLHLTRGIQTLEARRSKVLNYAGSLSFKESSKTIASGLVEN